MKKTSIELNPDTSFCLHIAEFGLNIETEWSKAVAWLQKHNPTWNRGDIVCFLSGQWGEYLAEDIFVHDGIENLSVDDWRYAFNSL